jgi:hypothetical protein
MVMVTSGTIELTWDSAARLAVLRFTAETNATGKDAATLIEAFSGWIGAERKPFALLGDGARLRGVDAAYRSAWGKFLLQHRDDSYVAFFNMNALIRVAAEMFGIGARVRLKTFGDEPAARAWLRGVGISA